MFTIAKQGKGIFRVNGLTHEGRVIDVFVITGEALDDEHRTTGDFRAKAVELGADETGLVGLCSHDFLMVLGAADFDAMGLRDVFTPTMVGQDTPILEGMGRGDVGKRWRPHFYCGKPDCSWHRNAGFAFSAKAEPQS
jgi:hypothetical protein